MFDRKLFNAIEDMQILNSCLNIILESFQTSLHDHVYVLWIFCRYQSLFRTHIFPSMSSSEFLLQQFVINTFPSSIITPHYSVGVPKYVVFIHLLIIYVFNYG